MKNYRNWCELDDKELIVAMLSEIQERYYALPEDKLTACQELREMLILQEIAKRWLGIDEDEDSPTSEFIQMLHNTVPEQTKFNIWMEGQFKSRE